MHAMNKQAIGSKICTLRKQLGMTQKQLAEKLHVTDKSVSKWERGVSYPDLELMENIAEALGITLGELLGIEENTERNSVACTFQELSVISAEEKSLLKREVKNTAILNLFFLAVVFLAINLILRENHLPEVESLGTLAAILSGFLGVIIGNTVRSIVKIKLL